MWICTNYGFFSIVKVNPLYINDGDNAVNEVFTVRTRDVNHLQHGFPNKKVFQYPNSDYGYRVYLTVEELNEFLLNEVQQINYANFKNSVKDSKLHKFFSEIWYLGVSILCDKPNNRRV
jgi:hypothetical protein